MTITTEAATQNRGLLFENNGDGMKIDNETAAAIGVALNEATLLGAEYAAERNVVALTFSVLTLSDEHSPEPSDPRRQILLTKVGRVVAALRESRWDDLAAASVAFGADDLLTIVQSFGGLPVYGWEFVNHDDRALDHWAGHASLVFEPSGGSLQNRISLFQEGHSQKGDRHLDLWIWFEDLIIRDPLGAYITLSDFTAGGRRWWDALYAGDSRTQGHGIIPVGGAR